MRPAHRPPFLDLGSVSPGQVRGGTQEDLQEHSSRNFPKPDPCSLERAGSWVVAEPPDEFDVQPGLGTRNQIYPFVLKVKKRASWGQPAGPAS